ncbi:MAG: thioredoxin family protein [Candidatus Thermoplasmatota archaeon]
MKRILLFFILIIILGCLKNEIEEISWLDYEKGVQKSLNENKIAILDFYADWCGPCRRMENETYKSKEVIEMMKNFVAIKINVDKQPEIANLYNVSSIPTIVYLKDGKEVYITVGFRNEKQFLADMGGCRKIVLCFNL